MSEQSAVTTAPAPRVVRAAPVALPRVNLLPVEVRESSRLRALQAGFAGGVLTATGVVAVLALAASASADAARTDLETAQAATTQVQAQVSELSYVRAVYSEVSTTQAAVDSARAMEIPWSRLLNDLSLSVPTGVWIESVSVAPAAVTPGQTPANYGTVTYTGRGRTHADVAAWLEALAGLPGLTDATFTTSAKDQTDGGVATVTFSSTAVVTEEALASGTEGS